MMQPICDVCRGDSPVSGVDGACAAPASDPKPATSTRRCAATPAAHAGRRGWPQPWPAEATAGAWLPPLPRPATP